MQPAGCGGRKGGLKSAQKQFLQVKDRLVFTREKLEDGDGNPILVLGDAGQREQEMLVAVVFGPVQSKPLSRHVIIQVRKCTCL